ncbi:MAG: LecA/PA-IL family lectin [Pyrinomonadaceae bacterium]
MFLRSTFFRSLGIAAIVAALSLVSFADTLRLKDGSIIKGKIVAFSGGKFTIVMGEGAHRHELTFSVSEVDSITFDDDSNVASSEPTRKYEPARASAPQQDTSTAQQADQKPRFKQWDNTGQKPSVVVTDNQNRANQTTNQTANQTASQKPPVVHNQQQQPPVIKTSATGSQPGRVDPPRQNANSGMQPIAWDVKVTADNTNNGWTNSGWVVRKGQRIRITGDGTVDLGKGKKSTPSGDPDIADAQKLLKNVATGALIAVIGDDNNDFIYVGAERTFTATRDGALFLGINEGYLDDNKGTYAVKIEVLPDDK